MIDTNTASALFKRFAYYLEQSERRSLTIKNYLSDLRGFAKWFFETNGDTLAPDKITPIDLREYKRYLQDQLRLKPQSIARKFATLKSFLQWAKQARLVNSNQVPQIPQPVRDTRRGPRWLDRREQNKLLRTIQQSGNIRDVAIVKLLLHTGLRVSELCALTWADVAVTERKGSLTVREGNVGKHR
jgi:site-specific recombinase XerD